MALNATAIYKKWAKENQFKGVRLSEEDLRLKELYESNFYEFIKAGWASIDGSKFSDNWHIEAIASYLHYLREGYIKNLIINISPRSGKTNIVSVLYLPWIWATRPEVRAMYTSSGFSLSLAHSRICLMLIMSEWYQKFWGNTFSILKTQCSKHHFANNYFGERICTSIDSIITGKGADLQFLDDPNDVRDVSSPTIFTDTNSWVSEAWLSRLNPIIDGDSISIRGRVVVQQRVGMLDVSNYLLSTDVLKEWDTLIIPNEFDMDRKIFDLRSKNKLIRTNFDPRKDEGELFWPQVITAEVTARKKAELGSIGYSGQYAQRPVPKEGGTFKKGYFKLWTEPLLPKFIYKIASFDTALSEKKTACYSAASVWGVFQDDQGYNALMLLNCVRGHWGYPDLKKMIERVSLDYTTQDLYRESKTNNNKVDEILIESQANGLSLIQDLFRSGIRAKPFNPRHYGFKGSTGSIIDSSKQARASIASSYAEQGIVFLPMKPPDFVTNFEYVKLFLEAILSYPRGDGADIVDTFSMTVLKLASHLDLNYRGQKPDPVYPDWRAQNRLDSSLLLSRRQRESEKI